MDDRYLEHHGVKGQRWGVRRYQYKDGSLTPKGRARMLEDARKYESKANMSVSQNYFAKSRRARLTQKAKDLRGEVRRQDQAKARAKKQSQDTDETKIKSMKDMSDDELEAYVRQKERRQDLERRYTNLNPKKVSKGVQFMKYVGNKILLPSAENLTKQLVTSAGAHFINAKLLPSLVDKDGLTDEAKKAIIDEYKVFTNNKKK